jgi:hypothetical protein
MAFIDVVETKIQEIIMALPNATIRNEVADAVAYAFQWETWRMAQDPPVADTDANRRVYARNRWALAFRRQTAQWLSEYRKRGDDEENEFG